MNWFKKINLPQLYIAVFLVYSVSNSYAQTPVQQFWMLNQSPNGLIWDNSSWNNQIDNGTGNWNTTEPNWTSTEGKTNMRWNACKNAYFGDNKGVGNAGIVTITSPIFAKSIYFRVAKTGNFTIKGSTISGAPCTQNLILNVEIGLSPTIESVLNGSNGIEKINTGTLILTGANTYTGTTTISEGILQVGNGSTTGALNTAKIVNNAELRYNRSDNITIANAMSGTGILSKDGTGTLTLNTIATSLTSTGEHRVLNGKLIYNQPSYRQNTTINKWSATNTGPTLQLSGAQNLSSGMPTYTNDGLVTVNYSGDFTPMIYSNSNDIAIATTSNNPNPSPLFTIPSTGSNTVYGSYANPMIVSGGNVNYRNPIVCYTFDSGSTTNFYSTFNSNIITSTGLSYGNTAPYVVQSGGNVTTGIFYSAFGGTMYLAVKPGGIFRADCIFPAQANYGVGNGHNKVSQVIIGDGTNPGAELQMGAYGLINNPAGGSDSHQLDLVFIGGTFTSYANNNIALTGGGGGTIGSVVLGNQNPVANPNIFNILSGVTTTIGTITRSAVNLYGLNVPAYNAPNTPTQLTGTGGFIKEGEGTLLLNAANTFSGDVTINKGIVSISSINSLGTGTVTINLGGTLRLNGLTIANTIINNGGTILP